jgi:heparan-sulfate lyase
MPIALLFIISNHKAKSIIFILYLAFFAGLKASHFPPSNASNQANDQAITLLLSRLDLKSEGLKELTISEADPGPAAEKLLQYFKNRKAVKHPVDRTSKKDFFGKGASESDITIADNAVQHVFVGQRAYPPHFCGEDINWNSRPVPDMEWVWQLNRMYFWNSMGKAYWHTGDEKYAKAWCDQLIDWTVKNPNDEAHKYAWRSIEAGIRGHSWMEFYQRFIDSPHFTEEVLIAFLNSCYDHASYLMTKYRSGSNWGLMEAEGMAFIAMMFPEFKDATKWRTEAFRRLNNEIDIQVYPDGQQRELAMGYHIGCIRWFFRTYELARLNGLESAFPTSYLNKIEKMCEVPMKLCLPDGTNVQFGDSWTGQPGQYDDEFLEWARFFNRDDFLYLATDGKQGSKPGITSYALENSGLYSMRSNWKEDAICLVLKCGPDGGGHCQPDNGTFDVFAGGRNFMPDAGSYIYSGDPEGRRWFRQTKVHQTLTLNDENSQYAPKLLLWQPGSDQDILVVENDSYDNLIHRRSVIFMDKRYFVIIDEAMGTCEGDIGLHFQLAPGKAIFDHDQLSVRTDFEEGWNIMVQTNAQQGLELKEEEGWVSFEYTKKQPRSAFEYVIRKSAEQSVVRFVTLVVPYEKDTPDISVSMLNDLPIGSKEMELTIEENSATKTISYALTN